MSLHVGQTGVRVGDSLWKNLTKQHFPPKYSDSTPNDSTLSDSTPSEAMFNETSRGVYVPRCVFTDLERCEVEEVRKSRGGHIYCTESFVTDKDDGASNYARGHYSIGRGLLDQSVDRVRREVERCESLQGIITTHCIGGGTGAGYTSLLNFNLRDMFKSKAKVQFVLIPSPDISPTVVEPYNAVLYLNQNLSYCDNLTVMFENQSLYKTCSKLDQIELPSYPDLNNAISRIISSITAPVRYPGSQSVYLDTIQTNIVPYPRISYVTASLTTSSSGGSNNSISEITTASFSNDYSTVYLDIPRGKLLSSCLLYRGLVTPGEVNTAIKKLTSLRTFKTCYWVPCPFKVGILDIPSATDPLSTTLCTLTNHTGIESTFARLNHKFDLLYQRRAFLHWYHGEGMEKNEFACAREETAALEKDYMYENDPPYFDRYKYKGEESEEESDYT